MRGEFAAFVQETKHSTGEKCSTALEVRLGISFRNPGFVQDDRHPAVCVNWDDAKAFVSWISKKTGKAYRLLSAAEREYVARAGTTAPFWWGTTITPKQANYVGSASVAVDCFDPNPWGLYNVHGNVWEWTEDAFRHHRRRAVASRA